ncbi:MAG: SDR family oxidoreductase [Phycisphaerales bacterium]|nr:SDR family oxidoreductase [Phycisphaerales bacterium]
MSTILVTGATGYIGGRLVPRLLERGDRVRCLARSAAKVRARTWAGQPGVEIVEANVGDVDLARHLTGCEVAYYLVHSMIAARSDWRDRDRELAANFARAAAEAGVKRIIYLGGLGETGDDLSEHLRSRREVEEALASTAVPVTVLRAAMIIGSGSASFEILRYLVEHLPVMITPKWLRTECQPIAIRNVLGYLLQCLDTPETAGRTLDIGGADVLTYHELIRIYERVRGLPRRWIIPVPVLTPRLSSWWIHLVTPLSHRIARPLAEGLRNRVVCGNDEAMRLMPQRILSVEESIRAALHRLEGREVETSWSDAGPIPGDPDWAGGTVYEDRREMVVRAPAEVVFRTVCRLGGREGYHAANWLWWIRGMMDRLVGGPGLRRGRRDPESIGFGDTLDFWRVTAIERDRLLQLRAEMRLPGVALLEFEITPAAEGTRLAQIARFKPRGLLGILYWYAVLPLHGIVFKGMLGGLRDASERASAASPADEARAPSE